MFSETPARTYTPHVSNFIRLPCSFCMVTNGGGASVVNRYCNASAHTENNEVCCESTLPRLFKSQKRKRSVVTAAHYATYVGIACCAARARAKRTAAISNLNRNSLSFFRKPDVISIPRYSPTTAPGDAPHSTPPNLLP